MNILLVLVRLLLIQDSASPRTVFDSMDSDKSGQLSLEEYVGAQSGDVTEKRTEEFGHLDSNDDGRLSLAEFRRHGNTSDKNERRLKTFERLDVDGDIELTLKEMVEGLEPKKRLEARNVFFKSDVDDSGTLSFDEFFERGNAKKMSPVKKFRARDMDDDGSLTLEEFLLPGVGKPYEKDMRDNFSKFDLNEDELLTEAEFLIMPAQKPSSDALFRGLDVDGNERLDVRELVQLSTEEHARLATSSFEEYDINGDGGLDMSEYTERRRLIRERINAASPANLWSWVAVAAGAAFAVLFGVFVLIRNTCKRRRGSAASG